MRRIASSLGSGGRRYAPRKTKPKYSYQSLLGDMDISTFYTLLYDLSWILALAAAGLGFVYVFLKPEEK